MQDFIYNPDVVSESQSFLLSQFRDKTRMLGLIRALTLPFQDIEDTLFALQTQRMITNAVGAQLDIIGTYVGLDRMGFNDDTYRLFIQIQIAINNSQGHVDQIISIMQLITGATNVLYLPYFPAAMDLQINVDIIPYLAGLPLSQSEFITLIQETIPAGVDLYGISAYNGPDNAFGFFEDPDALGYDEGSYAYNLY